MDAKAKDFNAALRDVLGSSAYLRVHKYVVRSRSAAVDLIKPAQIVSFDFFDTLVTRFAATPEAVQHYVGHVLQATFGRGGDFFHVRKYAETRARQRTQYQGDVDLDAIYAEIAMGNIWTREVIDKARELEQTIDSAMLLPRDDVVELARYAKGLGKRVIIVSDSYFPRSFFEQVLKRLGMDTLFDEIYVSSEQQRRKDNGSLWDLIVEEEGKHYKPLVHFGDNAHSDVQMAAARGVICGYLIGPNVAMAMRGFPLPREAGWREQLTLGPVFERLGSSPFIDNAGLHALSVSSARDLGYLVFGPILFYFMAWLLQNPTLGHVNKLFFLAREGYFLGKLYDIVKQEAGLTQLPEAVYLYVSRRAALSASQAVQFDVAQVSSTGGFKGTIAELLAVRLGLSIEELSEHPEAVAQAEQAISLPEDEERLNAFMDAHQAVILKHAAAERSVFIDYCGRAGLLSEPVIGLVDAGYSGTIQHALQRIVDRPMVGLYMATSPKINQVGEKGGLAFGCFQDAAYRDMRPEGYMHYTVLLEALLTAPHGQLSHFVPGETGLPEPVFKAAGLAQEKFAGLESIFAGVKEYAHDLLAAGGKDVLSAVVAGTPPMTVISQLVFDGLMQIDREVLDMLSLEDQFSGNGEVALADRFSPDAHRRIADRDRVAE